MKIAFVIPWYGKNIPGGAENECRKTALNLKAQGIDVEILTTCVKDFHSNWSENYHMEGVEVIEGLPVRRFKVRKRDTKGFDAVNYKLMHANMGKIRLQRAANLDYSPLSKEEEDIFIREMINSPSLYEYIKNSYKDYDFFIYIPYMFGTTYYGAMVHPDKTIIIPCLHDESYAYMNIYKEMLPQAKGIIYLSEAEQRLADRLYGEELNGLLLGGGIDTKFSSDGQRFLSKYSIDAPFILYAGRKDPGKNTPLLIEYFCRYKEREKESQMKLVLLGSGKVSIPWRFRKDIIDLGFVPAQEKYDAYAAALCLCQPSLNESFSIVIMESWVAGAPVLVHAGCEVTKDFCVKSNGGLYFSNYAEFSECVNFMNENPQICSTMGQKGRVFVNNNFAWDKITERFISTLKEWKKDEHRSSPVAA